MKVRNTTFTMKSNNEKKSFDVKNPKNTPTELKVRSIFLNDDLETIKIVYINNKSETFKYSDIEDLEYENLQL